MVWRALPGSTCPENAMPFLRRHLLAALAAAPLAHALGQANAQPAAGGRVVLTVSGRIRAGGGASSADFTLEALEALGLEQLVTETAWTTGPQRFSGVKLAKLLHSVGANGTTMQAVALNNYAVTVPVEDAEDNQAFLATRLDGQPMRVREKGPIWLIYPWSARPELKTAVFNNRAIWQLRRLEVG
jgi:hypothetical protein